MNEERRRVPARVGGAAIAAVALAFVLLVGAWLLGTHVHYVGTNSTAPRFELPGFKPGQRLCVRGLLLPGDANAIRIPMAGTGAPTPATLELTAGGRTQRARAVVPAAGFGGQFRFEALGRATPASACVRAAKPIVAEAGRPGSGDGEGSGYVDGHPVGTLSLTYLRLPGRTLLSQLAVGARRASLFRPGFVGPWLYLVLVFVVIGLWLVGMRLVLREAR